MRGDLAETIADLLKRRDAGEITFERVVIETTGLADPAPIQQTLLMDHYLAAHTRMDGVVTPGRIVPMGPKLWTKTLRPSRRRQRRI